MSRSSSGHAGPRRDDSKTMCRSVKQSKWRSKWRRAVSRRLSQGQRVAVFDPLGADGNDPVFVAAGVLAGVIMPGRAARRSGGRRPARRTGVPTARRAADKPVASRYIPRQALIHAPKAAAPSVTAYCGVMPRRRLRTGVTALKQPEISRDSR